MKTTGIIMSGNHPQLVLDGAKTMTRRTYGLEDVNKYHGKLEGQIFNNPLNGTMGYKGLLPSSYYLKPSRHKDYTMNPKTYHWFIGEQGYEINPIPVKCPYGQVGDRLWVRETFRVDDGKVIYASDVGVDFTRKAGYYANRYKPSIHMPRWASRITMEITEIRAERVQAITKADIKAEGVVKSWPTPLVHFVDLWDSLNAERGYSWESDPWCWCISFKLLKEWIHNEVALGSMTL